MTASTHIKGYLTESVIRGDVDRVRQMLSAHTHSAFTFGPARPHWLHLRIATLQNNMPMAKLLVTWGARPAPEELADFLATRDNAADDIRFLKLAGVDTRAGALLAQAFTRQAAVQQRPAYPRLPYAWQAMLNTLHAHGAPEALIAGGALRDLHNGVPPGEVDIFIREPLRVQKLLRKITTAPCHGNYRTLAFSQLRDRTYTAVPQAGNGGKSVVFSEVAKTYGARNPKHPGLADPLGFTKTWRVTTSYQLEAYREPHYQSSAHYEDSSFLFSSREAHEERTTFNIIMLGGDLGREMQDALKARRASGNRDDAMRAAAMALLSRFDIGLCQIAHDGYSQYTTPAYANDARHKRLTLLRPLETSLAHIAAVISKYPGHAVDGELEKVLREGKTQEPLSHPATYGHFHPRTMM